MKFSKPEVFAWCLESGGAVLVYATQPPNLALPPPYDKTETVVLEYGYNLPNPIPDLNWTRDGIHATLSFNQTPHETFVPWSSVYAVELRDENVVIVWKDAVKTSANKTSTADLKTPTKPSLSVVK